MTLNELGVGEVGVIVSIDTLPEMAQRLMAVGVTEACVVRVLRRAPLGDPLVIDCQGSRFALRREDAVAILVDCEGLKRGA